MPKLSGTDCVAIVLFIGCFIMIGLGHDGVFTGLISGGAAVYGVARVAGAKIGK